MTANLRQRKAERQILLRLMLSVSYVNISIPVQIRTALLSPIWL